MEPLLHEKAAIPERDVTESNEAASEHRGERQRSTPDSESSHGEFMDESARYCRQLTEEPERGSEFSHLFTDSRAAHVSGMVPEEPLLRPPGVAAAASGSASSCGWAPKMEIEDNGYGGAATRDTANPIGGSRPEEGPLVGMLANPSRGRRVKREKPLSKRMAKARLITPTRRSARRASGISEPMHKKLPSPKFDSEGRVVDKYVTVIDKSKPARRIRVPQIKREGSSYMCCVRGCSAAGPEPFTGIWLFALPADEDLRLAWYERVPVDPDVNRPLSPRLCFQHFDEEDFVVVKDRPRGLAEDAVPKMSMKDDL